MVLEPHYNGIIIGLDLISPSKSREAFTQQSFPSFAPEPGGDKRAAKEMH